MTNAADNGRWYFTTVGTTTVPSQWTLEVLRDQIVYNINSLNYADYGLLPITPLTAPYCADAPSAHPRVRADFNI